jgi:hypothetical protein
MSDAQSAILSAFIGGGIGILGTYLAHILPKRKGPKFDELFRPCEAL